MTQQPNQVAAAKPCEEGLFENSVAGNISWIYSMAYRQLADASLAADATQAVFLALWRKRGSLKKPIGGLLVRATRYACNDIQKSERRRKNRERKVAAMRSEEVQSVPAADDSNTLQLLALDAAMHKLSTGDRDVLVARFFQNQSARQMAQTFNISEAAAEKRITRAVIKLRGIMARKNISMDSTALAALLSSGAGTAPNGLLAKVLGCVSGKAPVSLTAAHAARSITFHTAHIPAIVGAAAVALALGVAAVAPLATKSQRSSAKPVSAEITPSRQVADANSTAAQSGVLTCVAYDMLVQKDFAWAIKTGGKLLSGKPGGVTAYDISARVVRALARAQSGGGRLVLGSKLNWLTRPLSILLGRGNYLPQAAYQMPVNFNLRHTLVQKKVLAQIFVQMGFQWHDQTYPDAMRLQVKFNTGANILHSYNVPIPGANLPYIYQGKLSIVPGRAVVLLQRVMNFQGTRWYSAVVFEVQRYPYDLLPAVNTLTGVGRYIKSGPAGLEHIGAVASAWARYTLAHTAKLRHSGARWTKSLPGGALATLQKVSTGRWPLCPWTPVGAPDGVPLSEIPWISSAPIYVGTGHASGLLKLEIPTGEDGPPPGASTLPKKILQYTWAAIRRQKNTCSVGLDSGPWKIIGTAKPTLSPDPKWYFSYKGYQFDPYALTPQPADPVGHIPSRIYMNLWISRRSTPKLADQAIAVGAVNRQGQLVSPFAGRMPYYYGFARFQTSRAHAMDEYSLGEAIPISPNNVKRYVWITRPRHWVTFRGFAMQPSPLPSTVFALQQQQIHTTTTRPSETAKPIAHIAANQTTPAGLMVLLRRAMRSGNPVALQKLAYAPTPAARHLLAAESEYVAAQNAYGLWGVVKKRFGVAQMQAAGLGEFIDNPFIELSNLCFGQT